MKLEIYQILEQYMDSCMQDSAHDKEHIYRVLYIALDIARFEQNVDYDILIAACLLHDIGRQEQFENPKLCHAEIGAQKAYCFLIESGFKKVFAESVKACIQTHRYRNDNIPQSIEAKILFDADKIDVTGAIGIARTLLYNGQLSEALYTKLPNGLISDGTNDKQPSFFQEYKFKLEKINSCFYTKRALQIATERQQAAKAFYESMLSEVSISYRLGISLLEQQLSESDFEKG